MDYMSTDYGAASSSRFPFRARTNKQTDATERSIHDGCYAGVGNNHTLLILFKLKWLLA